MHDSLEFTVTNALNLGDPCYGGGDGCKKIDAKPGKWLAWVDTVESFGHRIAKLHARCLAPRKIEHDNSKHSYETYNLGVDAGLMSIQPIEHLISDDEYMNALEEGYKLHGSYGFDFIKIRNGIWSSTGHGDGCYEAFVHFVDGKAVEIDITFIEDEDDESYEEDYEDEEEYAEEDE